ncbi:hypothetical protein NQ317_017861 [Molorchus minor]|uniref:Uncharacterized protein n=1 Tax=Molorchus minor TaxID=1323400 RepID=A0ABQ9K074_9CUCU|nr:hypothetical protein NQ317_017861 [Molorchus minor]
MADQLKVLVRKRASVKARLTLFKKYLDKFSDAQILIFQNEIEVLCDEGDLEIQYQMRSDFEDDDFSQLSTSKKIINEFYRLKDEQCNVHVAPSVSGGNVLESNSRDNESNCLKYLCQHFPVVTKNGWNLRDKFETLIHKNNSIGDIQKFYYLRASLDGMARQIIQSLEFSAVNYKIAWDTLCKRFDNKHLLIQNHLKGIFNIPVINQETAEKLRKVVDTVNKHLRALENLEQPVEHWDTLIIFTLTNKLDKDTLREWEGYRSKDDLPKLVDFMKFIQGRADLLET